MKTNLKAVLPIALTLLLAACDEGAAPPAGTDAKPTGATTAAAAAKPEAAKPAAPAAASEIDLSPAGDAWKGMTLKGPAGAKVADDGAGGAQVAFKEYQLTVNAGQLPLADMKSGAKVGAEAVQGKVTFTTDTADTLEYESALKDFEGKDTKMYGFGLHVDVGGKKYGCSGVGLASPADLAAAKDICKSLAKK